MTEQQKTDNPAEESGAKKLYTEEEIYASHGISQDLLQGMREYKNALFRGTALIIMILSFLMIIVCAAVCGIVSNITLLAEVVFSIEAMLLLMEKNANRIIRILARIFFFFPFPMILIMYGVVRYSPASLAVQITLAFFGILLLGTAVFGMVWYFTYYPYQNRKNSLRKAKADIRELRQISDREQRRAVKQKRKALSRLRKQERKERFLEEKRQLYEFAQRQKEKAQSITSHLPYPKKENEEDAAGSLHLLEGGGKGSGRRIISPENASLQASQIVAELERENKISTTAKGQAAGAELSDFEKK